MVLIKSFLKEALYDGFKLDYGYSKRGDKAYECDSYLKIMIQAYSQVDFFMTPVLLQRFY